jgi:hypothetical protein
MRLKVGDTLYLNPSKIKLHDKNEYTFSGLKFTFDELANRPFRIIDVRTKSSYGNGDDICIKWVDDTNWWWGQIGETEPWTNMFIDEKHYQRNKNLESLGI